MKTSSTAGPVGPNEHYSISPLARWDTDEDPPLGSGKTLFRVPCPAPDR